MKKNLRHSRVSYPAFRLGYHLPCCAFPGFSLSLTLPCLYLFYFHLPCCALIFLRAYPALSLFFCALPLCPFLRTYPAFLTLLGRYFSAHLPCSPFFFE